MKMKSLFLGPLYPKGPMSSHDMQPIYLQRYLFLKQKRVTIKAT